MKSFLLIMQQDPCKNSYSLEALEFALALSSFDQPVSLLFKNAGVLQLLVNQDCTKLILKDFTKIYSGLHLFGIDKIYIDQNSRLEYDTAELLVTPQVVDAEQIDQLIKDHDVVINL